MLWLGIAAHFLSERRDVIVITVTVVAAGGSVGFMDDHPRSLLSPGDQECPPASAAAYAEHPADPGHMAEILCRRLRSVPVRSEGALQKTVAAAAGRTLVLSAEPVHHVAGVSSVTAAQAEVGRAAYSHVTDGALEGETLTDGALRPTSLTAAVTAVQAELCGGGDTRDRRQSRGDRQRDNRP